MSRAIAQRVRDAGIVGAGGAGFPTHVKLEADAEIVIANGAECEPLLHCDKETLRAHAHDVLEGLSLAAEATSASRAVIALKGHYRQTVTCVREVARRQFPAIELCELDNFYPAGDEHVLVQEVTGRVVPEGGIPIHVGVVVQNVVTLGQVARAVRSAEPVTHRPVTVPANEMCSPKASAPSINAGGPDAQWIAPRTSAPPASRRIAKRSS